MNFDCTHAVLDYVGFGTMQLRFTIFTKLFHSVQFSLLWSFLRKLLRRLLTATNKSKMSRFCFVLRMDATPFYRLRHLPSFYSGIFPTAVINYFALYSEAGSLPRLKLRTAYAFLLTIRQANFPLKRTLPCTAQPFMLRLQEELLNGRSLCELERNPRRPTTNPQSVI